MHNKQQASRGMPAGVGPLQFSQSKNKRIPFLFPACMHHPSVHLQHTTQIRQMDKFLSALTQRATCSVQDTEGGCLASPFLWRGPLTYPTTISTQLAPACLFFFLHLFGKHANVTDRTIASVRLTLPASFVLSRFHCPAVHPTLLRHVNSTHSLGGFHQTQASSSELHEFNPATPG